MTREAAHSNVRPMVDCYHFWAGLNKFEDLDLIQPGEIHHVHFQDVPDIPRELLDNSTREIPGDGVSPLPRILRKLSEKGYSGPLSVKLFNPRIQNGDPFEVARRIREKAEPVMRAAGAFDGHIGSGAHGDAHVGLGECWSVVHAISRHRHLSSIRLQASHCLTLLVGKHFRVNFVDTESSTDGFRSAPAIAREHYDSDAGFVQEHRFRS